jgi:hypothetical protein
MSGVTSRLTTATLVALAALHVAWGRGSTFPFNRGTDLADTVVGTQTVPPPAACFSVAAALVAGAALVHDLPGLPGPVRRLGLVGMAGLFGLRGALGFAGLTSLISPGSTSARFRRLDRRLYSPLCFALAAGSWAARP